MRGDMRCWDCGQHSPSGICLGPHKPGVLRRGIDKRMIDGITGRVLYVPDEGVQTATEKREYDRARSHATNKRLRLEAWKAAHDGPHCATCSCLPVGVAR